MIEPIMYMAIGFLLAGLLVLGFIPLVHARAVRLTTKRLEAVTPMSMAEIQAEKDQLRAEFAMTIRRLEMNVEQLKAKEISHLAEIGKKGEAIGRLKILLSDKTAAVFGLESKEQALLEELHHTQQELAAKAAAFGHTEQALASKGVEFEALTARFNDLTLAGDSQRVELMALRAQVEVLMGQVESYEKETSGLNARIGAITSDSDTAGQHLAEERGRSEALVHRISELERHLAAQMTEAEILSRRVAELTALLEKRNRSLAEQAQAAEPLRAGAQAAQLPESATLADTSEAPNGAVNGNGDGRIEPGQGSLADRFRTLQGRAARRSAKGRRRQPVPEA
jgi:chromosome segregation ATPase